MSLRLNLIHLINLNYVHGKENFYYTVMKKFEITWLVNCMWCNIYDCLDLFICLFWCRMNLKRSLEDGSKANSSVLFRAKLAF